MYYLYVFYLLKNYPNISRAIINDINPNLILTYKSIKETPELLMRIVTIKDVLL